MKHFFKQKTSSSIGARTAVARKEPFFPDQKCTNSASGRGKTTTIAHHHYSIPEETTMLARLLLLAAFLGLSAPMLAQTGHPAKGSWSGDLVVGDSDKTRVRLL
ncbi:MAG: hypothetical protein ACO3PV_10405, partial [Pseudohongiellaceae bacterium]